MSSSTCKRLMLGRKPCGEKVIDGFEYCSKHLFFEDNPDEKECSLRRCSRCANMIFGFSMKRCLECSKDSIKSNEKAKSKKIKCSGIDRNLQRCRVKVSKEGEFCKLHSYLKDYTPEMLANLKICSCCLKCFYSKEFSTCEKCRGDN